MREAGFYWIKRKDRPFWQIAQWWRGTWLISGHNIELVDSEMAEIDERRIVRAA